MARGALDKRTNVLVHRNRVGTERERSEREAASLQQAREPRRVRDDHPSGDVLCHRHGGGQRLTDEPR